VEDIDPRPPQLTTVVLLAYAPVLVSLPILLVAGVFVVVAGGFFFVLGSVYCVLSWLIGLVWLAARWRRARRARGRAARADVVPIRPRGQPRFERAGAFASTPPAHVSRGATVSAANLSVARRAGGVRQLGPAERGPIRDSDDRRHVA
jgi:hypothetical protein